MAQCSNSVYSPPHNFTDTFFRASLGTKLGDAVLGRTSHDDKRGLFVDLKVAKEVPESEMNRDSTGDRWQAECSFRELGGQY